MKGKLFGFFNSNRKYLLYGSSIVFSRGLEYLILFLAPLLLTKQAYGDLEFYKRIIELSSTILVFGLPTLMFTYSKSNSSKVYLLIFSLGVILLLSIVTIPILYWADYLFLLIPILFYSIFFSNGIVQMYILVAKGSNAASVFKIIVSCIFYAFVFFIIKYDKNPSFAFVNSTYFLFPVGGIFLILLLRSLRAKYKVFLKYLNLFKKLLVSSSTLVISTIANMMFLYSDIFIVKLLSDNSSVEIANFSFVLNITNLIVIIPMTLIQVDIEKIKEGSYSWLQSYRKKIALYILVFAFFVTLGYILLINSFYSSYKNTLLLFVILIFGKIIQSNSVILGAQILIKKRFFDNLKINLATVSFNIIASYFCYKSFGLLGLAFISSLSLLVRYLGLRYYYKQIHLK
ncbi:MAG: oligosaccharide flippase family protein [Flavobacteriaceae bacterium]